MSVFSSSVKSKESAISLLNNVNGSTLTANEILLTNKVDVTVCLTPWHRNYFKELYPCLTNIKTINKFFEANQYLN